MRERVSRSFLVLLTICLTSHGYGETVYFLVAEESDPPVINDSYVLPLSDENDIAHARDLIELGPGIGESIVVADINCGADCINRDYLDAGKRAWWWHVTAFQNFTDVIIPEWDGWPGLVQDDCEWWMDFTGGKIGFGNYTVVSELGIDPSHWERDLVGDGKINNKDFAGFGEYWFHGDCNEPLWCDGADLNQSGSVDYTDLRILVEAWLSLFAEEPIREPIWFDCWDCPYQCHGDADCQAEGKGQYRVFMADLEILMAAWGCSHPSFCYESCADFDRDLDIDDDDLAIWNDWDMVKPVPADCPICR